MITTPTPFAHFYENPQPGIAKSKPLISTKTLCVISQTQHKTDLKIKRKNIKMKLSLESGVDSIKTMSS